MTYELIEIFPYQKNSLSAYTSVKFIIHPDHIKVENWRNEKILISTLWHNIYCNSLMNVNLIKNDCFETRIFKDKKCLFKKNYSDSSESKKGHERIVSLYMSGTEKFSDNNEKIIQYIRENTK